MIKRRLVLLSSILVVFFAALSPVQSAEKDEEYYKLFQLFADSFEQIERNYVKEVDRKELMEAAIAGMLRKLDPFSNYIPKEDYERFSEAVEQQFGGIGIQVTVDDKTGRLIVATPLPGTPAYRAGVRAGDVIEEVDGKSTKDWDPKKATQQAVEVIKGKPGTEVTLGVRHVGEDEIVQIKIVRAIIHVPTVLGDYRLPEGSTWEYMLKADERKIAYVRLTGFSRNSARELRKQVAALKKQGMEALILDLRTNPGGLLSSATEISDMFVDEGKIVSTKGRNTEEKVYMATKSGTYKDFPMVVLVNRFSASASEIVSACLQDHERAVVIGERTYGKGSVQNVINLQGSGAALKLTTASYHRPSGKNIHRFPGAKDSDVWGVMPNENFKIRYTDEQMGEFLKYRRDRDVISKDGPPKSDFVDAQRDKAVEYLVAQVAKAKGEGDAKDDKPEDKKPDKAEDKSEKQPEKKATSSLPTRRQRVIAL